MAAPTATFDQSTAYVPPREPGTGSLLQCRHIRTGHPPDSVSAMPMYYYDPSFSGPFVFPGAHPPVAPAALPIICARADWNRVPLAAASASAPVCAVGSDGQGASALALRRTLPPKARNPPRGAPGERRPSSETMDPSRESPPNASNDTIKTTFESLKQLRGIFIRLQAEHGVVILAFFDSRDASKALSEMQDNSQKYFEGSAIAARIPSYIELNQASILGANCSWLTFVQILRGSTILTELDSRVYITLVGQTTVLGPQMQSLLGTFGDLKLFRVVGMHYKRFHAEFFDSRTSATAILRLNNHKLHGAVAHLSSSPDSNVVPSGCSDGTSPTSPEEDELAGLLQATDLKAADEGHAYAEGIPFPSNGPDDAPTTPSSSGLLGYRARYGRRASTGSALPSSSPCSAIPQTNIVPKSFLKKSAAAVPSPTRLTAPAPALVLLSHSSLGRWQGARPLRCSQSPPTAPPRPLLLPLLDWVAGCRSPPFQGPLPPPTNNQWASPPIERDEDERGEELDGFIQVHGGASTRSSGLGGGAAHMCLPASARAVLDLLRDPPPERNRVDLARIEAGLDTRTTIMLKNVPNKMSVKNLIDFIEVVTPRAIDFLYLRFDFQNECNVGYAFVNFIDVSDLLKFLRSRLGRKWNMYASEKVLGAGYANYQGKEALVEKFKNSSIMDTRPAWRPRIFYSSGEQVGLPEPFPVGHSIRRGRRAFAHGQQGGLYTQMYHRQNQDDHRR
ncbi:hypothetical protein OPQ81_005945 [Rhizoctonia solani]|nr:hypothetical protein OPQ81_005945 [Rhizoctonia solani]